MVEWSMVSIDPDIDSSMAPFILLIVTTTTKIQTHNRCNEDGTSFWYDRYGVTFWWWRGIP